MRIGTGTIIQSYPTVSTGGELYLVQGLPMLEEVLCNVVHSPSEHGVYHNGEEVLFVVTGSDVTAGGFILGRINRTPSLRMTLGSPYKEDIDVFTNRMRVGSSFASDPVVRLSTLKSYLEDLLGDIEEWLRDHTKPGTNTKPSFSRPGDSIGSSVLRVKE